MENKRYVGKHTTLLFMGQNAPKMQKILIDYFKEIEDDLYRLETPKKEIIINFALKMKEQGKSFSSGKPKINLNYNSLRGKPKDLIQTFIHELCHILVGNHQLHGDRWANYVTTLGGTYTSSTTKWLYECLCTQHEVGEKMHKKISASKKKHKCNSCNGKLCFLGKARN